MPPLSFSVERPQFVSTFPEGMDQLWRADVTAHQGGEPLETFNDVLFVESSEMAYVYGMEFENAFIQGVQPVELAHRQQAFILFLRTQTRLTNNFLGVTALLFEGHEYACEYCATAAYVAARDGLTGIGVGYHNRNGHYELVQVVIEDEFDEEDKV